MLIQTTPESLVTTAENWWVEQALSAIDRRGRFEVALSGGSTPGKLYRRLAQNRLLRERWSQIRLWFGDERCVPPDHPQSNYRMVIESGLTEDLGLSLERMEGELEPLQAAARYAERLAELPQRGGWPQFDLVMLGMGADGHVASLFPGSDNLAERQKTVSACYVESQSSWRMSLTLPVLANGRQILVLVAGEGKQAMLDKVLNRADPAYPATEVAALEQATWMVDGHFDAGSV